MPDEPSPNLRGLRIAEDDPLRGTWNVIVLGPHYASMIAPRRRSETRSTEGQSFDFVSTYDRELIIECAQALTLRIGLVPARPAADPSGASASPLVVTGAASLKARRPYVDAAWTQSRSSRHRHPRREAGSQSHGTPPEFAGLPRERHQLTSGAVATR